MKKIIAMVLSLALVLSIIGCGTKEDNQLSIEEPYLIEIVDLTEKDGISTDSALEEFYKDENYTYYFPSIKSQYIECTLSDGTKLTIIKALEKGIASLSDLDSNGIKYYIQDKNGNIIEKKK